MHAFWKMLKGVILYVSRNKPGPFPKVWRRQVVQVLDLKAGGATDGENNIMLLRRLEEEWNPIVLKTWASKNISGCLGDKFLAKQVQMGTFAPIKDKVF